MQVIGILTALAISFGLPSKNANTLERDTRAIATLDCKLLATATKVGSVLDVEREAKNCQRDAKTYACSASATWQPSIQHQFLVAKECDVTLSSPIGLDQKINIKAAWRLFVSRKILCGISAPWENVNQI